MKPLNVISLFFISCLFIISGCGNDTIQQIFNNQKSDLTRSGKFISFTSNKDGSYDIFLAQVDANGNLATTGLVYPDNPHNLTNSMNLADKQSNWSPNGRILVFSSKDMTT
jgi:Tol biopolymer transport system component